MTVTEEKDTRDPEEEEEKEEEEVLSMLNIRMSRTPIEGSPVPGCLTPR